MLQLVESIAAIEAVDEIEGDVEGNAAYSDNTFLAHTTKEHMF
jgi:hypothetical protein